MLKVTYNDQCPLQWSITCTMVNAIYSRQCHVYLPMSFSVAYVMLNGQWHALWSMSRTMTNGVYNCQ